MNSGFCNIPCNLCEYQFRCIDTLKEIREETEKEKMEKEALSGLRKRVGDTNG